LALGSAKLEWEVPEDPKVPPPIWTYVLNYTGSPCSLYGGDSLEEAMRNVTNGLWLKSGDKNCAFYVVVGNNEKLVKNAEFTFYRTNALYYSLGFFTTIITMITLTLSI
jgi:hypothetical protein